MKKNKKLLLASIAAMGVIAMGVGATSTFAWYTASSAATINRVADSSTISTESGVQSVGTYYAKASFAAASYTVTQTDASGNCWVIVGGYLQPASAGANGKFASSVITLKFYQEEACSNECTAAQYKEIGTSYDSITVTVGATGRVRVTDSDPTSNFATAFSGKLAAASAFTFTVNIATTGALTNASKTAYISVFGQAGDDATLSAGSGGDLTQFTDGGTVTTSCAAAHARS